jgi:hypothetical protein
MSEKDIHKEMSETADRPSANENVSRQEAEHAVFYRCNCPECGRDDLNLIDSGVFLCSPVVGITGEGEIGCSHTELDGDHELGLICRECGHTVCSDYTENLECQNDLLLKWAKSHGEAVCTIPFRCPVCDSNELNKVETGIDLWTVVEAVCEAVPPNGDALEAVSPVRHFLGRIAIRYRCSSGHELAKDDGSPVENPKELVEWLKAHRRSIDG